MKNNKLFNLTAIIAILSFSIVSTSFANDTPPPSPGYPKPVAYPWLIRPELFEGSEEGDDIIIEPRIVGGSDFSPGDYPWIVSLQYFGVHYCGGTLIDPEWILTSAHCWTDLSGVEYDITPDDKAVLGAHDFSDPTGNEQVLGLAEVHRHPGYDFFTFENDVALLKLSTPAAINSFVDTIQVVGSNPGNLNYTPSIITGWGDYFYQQPEPFNELVKKADIQILPNSLCGNYGIAFNPTSMLCGGLTNYSKDACQGDSGGSLFFDINGGNDGPWYVAGVTSWGSGCAKNGFPGIYARVSDSSPWIRGMTGLADIPIPISPENNGEFAPIQFTYEWTGVTGYTRYHLLISRYANFTAPMIRTVDAVSNNPGFGFPPGPVFWKVRVVNTSTFETGEWSIPFTFLSGANGLPIPENTTPSQNAQTTDRTPSFTWAYNGTPTKYQFQLSHYSTFDTPLSFFPTTKSFTAPTLETGVWFWRVRGIHGSVNAPWSEWRRMTILTSSGMQSASMNFPAASTVIEDLSPRFNWGDIGGASSYELQLSRYSNFHSIDPISSGISEYTFPSNIPGGTIFWRARGVNGATNGPWSEWRKVIIKENDLGAPQPLTPNHPVTKAAGANIPFKWGNVGGAIGYEFSVKKEGGSETIYPVAGNEITLSFTPGVYHWKIRAVGGPWSEIRIITIQ